MLNRLFITAMALSVPLAVGACATSNRDSEFVYRVSPPSSNPHDVFRSVTKVPRPVEADRNMPPK